MSPILSEGLLPPNIAVEVSNTQAHVKLDRAWIDDVVIHVCLHEGKSAASLSISVIDDASIRVINARYLGHDWATDVISFPDLDGENALLAGELIISAEMAVKMAALVGSTPHQEFALYLVHGLLHLCGYDDQDVGDVAKIRRREAAILKTLGIENPFNRSGLVPAASDQSGRESVCWPR